MACTASWTDPIEAPGKQLEPHNSLIHLALQVNLLQVVSSYNGFRFHPHFLRGKPSSLASIKRTAVKRNLSQHPPRQIIVPDFYGMPEIEVDGPDEVMRVMGIGKDWPTLDHLLQKMAEINNKDDTKEASSSSSREEGSNGSEIVDPTDMLDGIVQLPGFAPKSATTMLSSNAAANLNELLQTAPSPLSSHQAMRRISWNGSTSTAASSPLYAYALNPTLLGATGQPYQQNVGHAVPLQRQASNSIQELQVNAFNAMMSYNWQNDAINGAHVNNEDDLVTKAIRYANMSTARRASCPPMFTTFTCHTQPNLQSEFVASTPQLDAHPNLGTTTHPMNVNQGGQYLNTNQFAQQQQPDQYGSTHSSVTLPLPSPTNATTSLESHPSIPSALSYLAGGIKEEDNNVFPSEELVSFQEPTSANIHNSFHESNVDDDEFAQFIHDWFPRV